MNFSLFFLTLFVFGDTIHEHIHKIPKEIIDIGLSTSQEQRVFEDNILHLFQCIQNALKTGITEVGLPPLEPLELPYLNIDLSDFGTSGFMNINNTVITGLTNLKITDLHINPIIIGLGISVKANLILPSVTICTDYEGKVTINKNTIFGKGNLNFTVKQLAVSLDSKLLFQYKGNINLSKFKAVPSVKEIQLEISGFYDDDEQSALMNQLVDEEGVAWVNGKSQDIADVLEEYLKNVVNNLQTYRNIYENNVTIIDIIYALLEKCPLE